MKRPLSVEEQPARQSPTKRRRLSPSPPHPRSSPPRAASAPPSARSAPLPLTSRNLTQLQDRLLWPSMNPPRRPSSRSSSKSNRSHGAAASDNSSSQKLPTKERYALFRIMYEDGEDLPEELAEHVAMLKAPREAPSPNAAELSSRALTARSFGEQDGIDTLKAKLFFRGAIDGGTPFTAVTARTNLSSRFIPQRPVPPGVAPIEQPQPDQAVGYLPTKTACRSKLKAPFTREEEDLISLYRSP